ncbi:MAG: hydroxymethylbilane synthase [Nitrospirota bacterium]|nr:hydroxymethylbilane synthase [Nitrospirota bacterium]
MTRTASTTTSRSSLVIGTRGSRLAIWQAEWIQDRLHEIAPALTVTLQRIKTSGDKILDVPLAKIGGKGLFVKEIEEALLRGEIDLAVHSMKDVPTMLPDALEILCVPAREDARDALISREGHVGLTLNQLPTGARIGTSSLRRQSQLLHHRPDLKIEMLRGNVETRLRKVKQGDYDAIVLAAAGLRRMGWDGEVTEYLSLDVSLPAIGQGALAIEGRRNDEFVRALLSELDDPTTHTAVTAERALLDRLQGGCQVPIAAHATIERNRLSLAGLVSSPDGTTLIRDAVAGSASDARGLGLRLAEQLLAAGADVILRDLYGRE